MENEKQKMQAEMERQKKAIEDAPKHAEKVQLPPKRIERPMHPSGFPNKHITEKHIQFFHKYGFMIVKGLHSEEQTKKAREGAEYLLENCKGALDGGKGEQAFKGLPEHKRSTWARCEEPRLMSYFEFPENHKMCENIIGEFEFKHHPGPGYYTFAPRFYQWSQEPKVANENQERLIEPYDLNNLPGSMSEWSKEFLRKGAELGMKFAPANDKNWHIDGIDYKSVSGFAMLWGSYINALPKGNMGNLTVRPGTHFVIADIFKNKGPYFLYDGKKEQAKPLPELKREGVADGEFYSVCVEAGDVLLAHPWLAHGIGGNFSREIRMAVYCRLGSPTFYMKGRTEMAGTELKPTKEGLKYPDYWRGDMFAGFTRMNSWMKDNKDILNEYDEGRLQEHLKKM